MTVSVTVTETERVVSVAVSTGTDWDSITGKPTSFPFPTVVRAAGNYTLAITDQDTTQRVTAAAVITVPLNADVAFAIGALVSVFGDTAGEVRFLATSGVTILSENGLILNAQYAVAALSKIATDTWLAVGSLKAA